MTRNERQLKAVESEMQRHSAEAQSVWKKAEEDDREATPEEKDEVLTHIKAIEELKTQKKDLEDAIKVEQEVRSVGEQLGRAEPFEVAAKNIQEMQVRERQTTPGQIFVQTEQYKSIQDKLRNGGRFEQVISLDQLETKAGTLLEGTLAPGSGQGGGLVAVPQVAGGVVEKLFQPVTVPDIIPTGQTNGNTIRYVVEGTATNSAAAVAEGGTKPASDLALSTTDEQVKKLATVLTVSDEMLEDSAQVESYIDRRLTLFVRQAEETSVVSGAGGSDITGITARSINTYARGTVDNNVVALFKAINGTRGSSFLEPDYIVMHPDNWQTTRLLQDANNQFYGGGPFTGAYGNGPTPQGVTGGQVSGAYDYLWNKPVIVTTAVGSGTALLGAFNQASMIYRRSGITVEASNSHSTYFASNLVMIRAETRLALCVFRPAAFTKVTGLA